jgi:hypothetical protein
MIDVYKKANLAFMTPYMKSELGLMLGFDSDILTKEENDGEHPATLDPVHSLYIYGDCIKPVTVGDSIAQLLVTVPVTVNRPRSIYYNFSEPRFIPVSKQVIDRISLSVHSSSGKPIPFNGGNCFVKLLFRKVKQ